jgi:glycosyltransferase involved in cell wall biosynthesis
MISVIVPVYNTSQYLARTIEALLEQDYAPDQRELIFVDNGSTDDSLKLLQSYAELRVFSEPERGSYMARNLGVRQAAGDILAFTDSDCYPLPGWLSAIAAALSEGRADIVMGPRLPLSPGPALHLISEYENRKAQSVFDSMDPLVYFGYTNNMGMRKSVMDRFGPFERRARGADTIFIRRVVDGTSCEAVAYCEDMAVRHAELDSINTYYKKINTYGRSRQAYRHIIQVRPLSMRERLNVFWGVARKRGLADTITLFALLIGGVLAWWWGSIRRPARGA